MDVIISIISDVGGIGAIFLAIAALIKTLAIQKATQSMQEASNKRIELLRDELTSNQKALDNIILRQGYGQDLAQTERIKAVKLLWSSVIDLRDDVSKIYILTDVLMPSEYDHILDTSSALGSQFASYSYEDVLRLAEQGTDIEKVRPFVGEDLWLDYFIFRAYVGRVAVVLCEALKKSETPNWKEDSGIRQLVEEILPHELVSETLSSEMGYLRDLSTLLEAKIYNDAKKIVSGEAASEASAATLKKLSKLAQI